MFRVLDKRFELLGGNRFLGLFAVLEDCLGRGAKPVDGERIRIIHRFERREKSRRAQSYQFFPGSTGVRVARTFGTNRFDFGQQLFRGHIRCMHLRCRERKQQP